MCQNLFMSLLAWLVSYVYEKDLSLITVVITGMSVRLWSTVTDLSELPSLILLVEKNPPDLKR